MSDLSTCPRCGTVFSADSPGGLCPKCLLQAGLESGSVAEGEASVARGGGPEEAVAGRVAAPDSPRKEPEAEAAQAKTTPMPPKSGFVPPAPQELAPLFPQLEILEMLGRGGMGAVYKARQRELGRLVALKILPAEVGADPEFAERFAREARALARLTHPGIVTVYDFGRAAGAGPDAAPVYYFVMEYVDGANLRQLIRSGDISPAQALAIVPQVCEALQYAHDEGVVHRDIKPENILVDKRGRVKIADFGLSKLVAGDEHEPPEALTGTEQVMGTLRYMAPEQMMATRNVDHRADIYSLGVVFYELLTGEVPVGRFEPPSHRVQVDVRLDEVVLRALEREPAKRYQRAGDVKTEVEAISSGRAAPRESDSSAPAANRDELERMVIARWPDKIAAMSEYHRRTGLGLAASRRAVELIATLHGLRDERRERANRLGIVAVVCLGIVAVLWALDRSGLPESARNVLTVAVPLAGLAGLIVFAIAWRKADASAAGRPTAMPVPEGSSPVASRSTAALAPDLRRQAWAACIGLSLVAVLGGAIGLIALFAMSMTILHPLPDGTTPFAPNLGSLLVPPCFLAAGLFVAWGADLLRRFRRYDICIAASLVAVVLAVLLIGVKQRIEFFLGILPGLYAFWFLQKQAVKDAFAAGPGDDAEESAPYVLRSVGTALVATGLLTSVAWLAVILLFAAIEDGGPTGRAFFERWFPLVQVHVVASLILGPLAIRGGLDLRRLEGSRLAQVAAVACLVPFSVAWLVGLPVGLWALAVLRRPESQAALHQAAEEARRRSAGELGESVDDASLLHTLGRLVGQVGRHAPTSATLILLVCGFAAALVFAPWGYVTVSHESPGQSGSFGHPVTGLSAWPGIAAAATFGTLGLLLLATSGLRPAPRWRAVAILIGGAAALVFVGSYEPILGEVALTWNVPGESGANVSVRDVRHTIAFRDEGRWGEVGLAIAVLVLGAVHLRAVLSETTARRRRSRDDACSAADPSHASSASP